jgi:hypothetical protein
MEVIATRFFTSMRPIFTGLNSFVLTSRRGDRAGQLRRAARACANCYSQGHRSAQRYTLDPTEEEEINPEQKARGDSGQNSLSL